MLPNANGQKPEPTFKERRILTKERRFNFRVSEFENDFIRYKASKSGMSLTEYILNCAMEKEIVNYDALTKFTTQVKKLGNNVNQLLILARQGKIKTVNLAETQNELHEIYLLVSMELKRKANGNNSFY